MLEAIAAHGLTLTVALCVALAGLTLGSLLLRTLRLSPTESILNATVAWAVGMGMLMQIWLFLGLLQLYRPPIAWTVVLLCGVAGLIEFGHHGKAWRIFVQERERTARRFSMVERLLLAATGL